MKFSCIIPSVGRETLISKTIPSVENQTRKFDQIIISFDLNPDCAPDCASHHCVSRHCVLYTGGGQGGPAARRLAYARAFGNYAVLLDDDDELDPKFLECCVNFLSNNSDEPALLLPRVRKIWPEGMIPSSWEQPPTADCKKKAYLDLSNVKWMPKTSSGLVVSKSVFRDLPVTDRIQGFNDVQICDAARRSGRPIFYCKPSVVKFYQYFSIQRLTSDLESRRANLQAALEHGMELSEAEQKAILLSAIFSQARSVSYRIGLLPGIKSFADGCQSCGISLSNYFGFKLLLNFACIIWLSLSRHFGGIQR